ncbi:hypothetical protein HW115_15675 [Verrucomicrobiaceae bacterium N1E253]|uniref:Uncharacterized protein n=1 Tax=Oceaniferula marina TaxID=2748318 RepID=A0A851GJ93_9BACT|nr:hypothetical protein [Oceaniferula marina]NWK57062.1 hypothetical protein [Oceaniferula marina]
MSNPSIGNNIPALCRGDAHLLQSWIEAPPLTSLRFCIPAILIGCSCYGFTMGLWQGWEMASYVGIKLPLLIFATLMLNGMLNGMLAMALSSGIGFRQSIQFLLAGFALMAIILGSLSPITFMMALHAPAPEDIGAKQWHSVTLLSHTLLIAYAGVISHRSLLSHVRRHATTPSHGTRTFFAWLAGNLFAGAQISWVMRPFFGSPGLEVQFFRDNPMNGNFYETVWRTAMSLLGS